jgi:hypothetical protein
MGITSKSLSLILIATLAISSLIMAQSSIAQATPKPSVPKFSLKYVENSYDVPATYGIDPYTGKTIIVQQGGHSESRHIEVTIKNQPFTPYSENSFTVVLMYQMQTKGHYASDKDWRLYDFFPNTSPIMDGFYYTQLGSEDIVISVPAASYEVGDEVDFQVRTLIGYTVVTKEGPGFTNWLDYYGETGDWSSTQTIKIEGNAIAATPDSIWPYQDYSDFPSNQSTHITYTIGIDYSQVGTLVLLAVIAVLLAVIAVLLYKRNPKQPPPPPNTHA